MSPDLSDALLQQWDALFMTLHQRVLPHFLRVETQQRVSRLLRGFLQRLDRKNSWQLAEALQEPSPHGVQRLLNGARWDAEAVRDELRSFVVEHLAAPDGVLVLDETGFLKQGAHSVGVARQYSGTAGRIENQQIGVFLAYTTPRGTAFIDRALYLPEEWTQNPTRCQASGIPPSVGFATKPALAQQLLERAFAAQVPARWVVADSVYSTDDLQLWLQSRGRQYVLMVPCTYPIWTAGQQVDSADLVAQLPAAAWQRLSAGAGSQGARLYDWTWLQLPYQAEAGMQHWLLGRRSLHTPATYAYYHVYAAATSTLAEVVQVAGARWTIETGFAQSKGEVGLDQYQVRTWTAWYRHITLALLAYAYLVVARAHAAPLVNEGVPVSVPEVRRLLRLVGRGEAERHEQVRWSRWRRQHQARARHYHEQRRHPTTQPPADGGWVAPQLPGIGDLTDQGWQEIAPLLPRYQRHPNQRSLGPREALEAMVWVMQRGVAWRTVPETRAAWHTVYSRYQQWRKAGIWQQIVQILDTNSPAMPFGKVLL
jgi:SRSO17 transposase/transposase